MSTDNEMLDWLESNRGLLNFSNHGPHVCIDDGTDVLSHFYGTTYREALQAALEQYKQPSLKRIGISHFSGTQVFMKNGEGWEYRDGAWHSLWGRLDK